MLKPPLIRQLIKTTKRAGFGIPGRPLSRLDVTSAGSCPVIPKNYDSKRANYSRIVCVCHNTLADATNINVKAELAEVLVRHRCDGKYKL